MNREALGCSPSGSLEQVSVFGEVLLRETRKKARMCLPRGSESGGGLSVSDGCRPFGPNPRVFRNGPLVAAGRAPKKPVPDLDVLGECQHASMGGMAPGAGNGIVEDIEGQRWLGLSFAW